MQIYLMNSLYKLVQLPLAQGKFLFPRRVFAPTLKLISVHQMGEGMVELHYTVERSTTI